MRRLPLPGGALSVKPPQDALTVRRLRLGVGILGVALPIVLPVGNALLVGRPILLHSISSFYYTDMRDIFVGSMCAIGVFLICYRYDRPEDVLSTIAGALAIVVALFPTTPGVPASALTATARAVGWVHQVCAAALFLLLAGFCFFLFTRTDPAKARVPERRIHNGIYRTCGGVILGAVVLAVASAALPRPVRDTVKPLFWCEAVAVFAFGVAWLVKGAAIIRDARSPGEPVGGAPVQAEDPPVSPSRLAGAPAAP